jgi:hypothetical protein
LPQERVEGNSVNGVAFILNDSAKLTGDITSCVNVSYPVVTLEGSMDQGYAVRDGSGVLTEATECRAEWLDADELCARAHRGVKGKESTVGPSVDNPFVTIGHRIFVCEENPPKGPEVEVIFQSNHSPGFKQSSAGIMQAHESHIGRTQGKPVVAMAGSGVDLRGPMPLFKNLPQSPNIHA